MKNTPLEARELPINNPLPLTLEGGVELITRRVGEERRSAFEPLRTGIDKLDEVLGGGIYKELGILGGPSNVGKTSFFTQLAVSFAEQQQKVLYLGYEPDDQEITERILCQESARHIEKEEWGNAITLKKLHAAYLRAVDRLETSSDKDKRRILDWIIEDLGPIGNRALGHLVPFWNNLFTVHAHWQYTNVQAIEKYIIGMQKHYSQDVVLLVDMLQLVPVPPVDGLVLSRKDTIHRVILSFDEYVKKYKIPILAISAADDDRARNPHIHLEDQDGPNILQYIPALALMLNSETQIVKRLSLEKTRHGPSDQEWRIDYTGQHYLFSNHVTEVAPEDSWQLERGRRKLKATES